MDKLIIQGGKPLWGEVNISGMKNSALPILFGTIAAADICTIGNVPDVSDIALTLETLRTLGAKVRFVTADTVLIDTREVIMKSPPAELVGKMRGSTYLIGAMLGRFGAYETKSSFNAIKIQSVRYGHPLFFNQNTDHSQKLTFSQ